MAGVAEAYFGTEASQPFPRLSIEDLTLQDDNTEMNFYDIQRKRAQKFAEQFLEDSARPVAELISAGSTTVTPEVERTRRGFQDFRRMQVLQQWWTISQDPAFLTHVKQMIIDWSDTNMLPETPAPPSRGHPINQTHFEGLHWTLRTLAPRGTRGQFTVDEYTNHLRPWLNRIRTATEAWAFPLEPGGGNLAFGNHYTHHLQQLVMLYESLGDFTAMDDLFDDIDTHAEKNFPYGLANDDNGVNYPADFNIVGVDQVARTFTIKTERTRVYTTGTFDEVTRGFQFQVQNSTGNNGTYTCRTKATWNPTSEELTIFVEESIPSAVGDGNIHEEFDVNFHDMVRAATHPGESIDFIRRDAFHYQSYDVLPWCNIAVTEALRTRMLTGSYGTRYRQLMQDGFDFLWNTHLNNADTHTEFTNSTDDFDEMRWLGSRSEYLQPDAFWLHDEGARLIMNYYYYRLTLDSSFALNDGLMALTLRGDRIASDWAYWLRFILGV